MASALRQTGRRAWERSGVLQCVKTARTHSPFTRASSAGLAGKRTAACLRLEEPSSAGPCQTEQRSEPEGPRSRVPGGIAKGGRASGPPWLAVKAKGGTITSTDINRKTEEGNSPQQFKLKPFNRQQQLIPQPEQPEHETQQPGRANQQKLHILEERRFLAFHMMPYELTDPGQYKDPQRPPEHMSHQA